MILKVIIWTASILKVVSPTSDGPLYIFRDPTCKLKPGIVEVHVEDLLPPDPTSRVGTLTQGKITCDVLEIVYPGV
jgi:hypothetical protein